MLGYKECKLVLYQQWSRNSELIYILMYCFYASEPLKNRSKNGKALKSIFKLKYVWT